MSIQNEILNAIASRRSCRAYKPEQITAEELEAVTTAGTWAATAMGRQSPVMVAVQDKETLAELSRLNAAVMGTQNDPFYGAPTAVLVLGEKNNPNGVQDASLVMGNLMLAASGIGLGSCWINRAKETFETPEVAARRADVAAFERRMNELAKTGCYTMRQLAVNGADLMDIGIPAGPGVGATLQTLLNDVMEGTLPNEREALLAAAVK